MARDEDGFDLWTWLMEDGGDGLVDLREHGSHAGGCRRRGGQEAHVGAGLLEGAVGHETVQMHVEPEVTPEPLHYREHPSVQRLHRCEAVPLRRTSTAASQSWVWRGT